MIRTAFKSFLIGEVILCKFKKAVYFNPALNELAIRVFNKYPEYNHDENLWELEMNQESEHICRYTFTRDCQAISMGWFFVGWTSE